MQESRELMLSRFPGAPVTLLCRTVAKSGEALVGPAKHPSMCGDHPATPPIH